MRRGWKKFLAIAALGWLGLPVGFSSAWAQSPDPDLNDDGIVNILDLSLVGSCFGANLATAARCLVADTDGDGDVDFDDYLFVVGSFGQSGFPEGSIALVWDQGNWDVRNWQ